VGCAEATNCILPLNEYVPQAYLADQLKNSVGYSHLSYNYKGKQWALAIDAATPAASYRKDLMLKNNIKLLPGTWNDLIELAKKGKVAVPAIPIDLLMNFYTFCIAHGKEPFAELMSATDDFWYCPFAYGYSNYSRTGFAKNLLHYHDVISYNGRKLRTTIGGTGLAISSFSKNKEAAINFAMMVVSGKCQQTLYVQHGGQPGHRSAWVDEDANRLTHDFFENVLPVMDNGYVRPRYNGHLHFQDHAGIPLQKCLMGNMDAVNALDEMNRIYQQSLIHKRSIATV
jgi:multiple sugar transport system substrate-binding protein